MHNIVTRTLGLRALNPVVRADVTEDERLANMLGRAFHDEPKFIYIWPEERARREVLPTFFLETIRVARLHGEIDTTPTIDGAAVWICPRRDLAFAQMVRTRTAAIPFKVEKSFKSFLNLATSVDEIHHRLVREPHWYLMALAVEPTQQGHSICGLLDPGLSRADSDGLLCYLETFQEGNLRFYEEHGFRIAGAGCIPRGPNFWAMIRTPR